MSNSDILKYQVHDQTDPSCQSMTYTRNNQILNEKNCLFLVIYI